MFPLDSVDMDKFIFNESKQKWEDYISNIKKILNPSSIITNDTTLEENINKIDNKYNYTYNINSNNNSFDEKDEGLFSYNDEENIDEYI